MLNFYSPELCDIERIRTVFQKCQSRICDETIGGFFMWRDYYHAQIAVQQSCLIFRYQPDGQENPVFAIPADDRISEALDLVADFCREEKVPMHFCLVSQRTLDYLQKERRLSLKIQEDPDFFDYLYPAVQLCEMAGTHFSGQRNHMKQFYRSVSSSQIEPISSENIAELIHFLTDFKTSYPETTAFGQEELSKTFEVLEHFEEYGMFGMILRAGKEIAGFSIGEIIYDTLFVHIEKADRKIRGVYPVLVNLFTKYSVERFPQIKYVNREEDVGDPGLRKSKLSYKPVALLKKYMVEVL